MANILKNLRRKRKRKKSIIPQKTVIMVGVVAAVAILIYFYVEKRSYHDYEILQTSEQEDVVSTGYDEMANGILRYSPDGASLVNSSMEAYWSVLYEMKNPVADIKGDRAVVADQDGTLIEIFDKDGETGSITTSYNIIKARVSSQGMVAAILDGGDATWINFYGPDGSLIAENQTHVADPGYPMDVAISDNSDIMMVTYQFVEGSQTTSYVAFYNFGDIGQSEDDRIVSGYTYEGVVIPQIEYLDSTRSAALKDNGFTIYSGTQIPKEGTTVEVKKEIVSTFFDENTIGLVFKSGKKDKQYTMQVYGIDGTLRFEKEFNVPYTTIKMSDGCILMYNSSQICVMNSRGSERYNGTIDGTINNFFKIGWNKYMLVLDNGVNVIKFK